MFVKIFQHFQAGIVSLCEIVMCTRSLLYIRFRVAPGKMLMS